MTGVEVLGAEGGALDGVVFVELKTHRGVRVARLPAPLADGDELQGDAFFPAQAGAFAADEEAVADADVGGDDEAGGAVGGEDAFGEFGGLGRGGVVDFEAEGGFGVGFDFGVLREALARGSGSFVGWSGRIAGGVGRG